MFRELQCSVCGCDLYGDLDTYGEPGAELCQTHWLALTEAEPYERTWYGLAPHRHDLSRTGSFIGSTVFDPLPAEKNEQGEYEIKPGLYFWPDPDAESLGVWRDTRPSVASLKAQYSSAVPLFSKSEQ